MFLAVAKKSRTFSSFPCMANEQVYKNWEGAQPGNKYKLANGIFHTTDIMLNL